LADADGAGYLGLEDSNEVQKARIDFGIFCEGLAAEYIHIHLEVLLAKQGLRADIREIETQTDTAKFTADEAALFDRFARHVDESINRLAGKSSLRLTFALWFFRTPGFVIALFAVALITFGTIVFGRIFAK
jgi:hypothetical protein